MKLLISDLQDLNKFAAKVAKSLRGGEVLALIGELGAGKTTFTKALLKELGVKGKTASPTFVLMIPYKVRLGGSLHSSKADSKKVQTNLVHMDLYRLKSFADVEALGVPDSWNKKENIYVIEWADKISRKLPKNAIRITIKIKRKSRTEKSPNKQIREIIIKNAPKYFKI